MMNGLNWCARGCALFLMCAAIPHAGRAQTFTTLLNFDGTNGEGPCSVSLVQGTDGNLYGTTCKGYGTVFKMTPTGILTTLHSFAGYPTDGASPFAGLVLGTDGSFYGTTAEGGANDCGTVFRITSAGTLTTLHSFDGTDGAAPLAALVQAADGDFYGTTELGGAGDCINDVNGLLGCGTVFKITSDGTLTTLHSFDLTDGEYPYAALIQATDGNFYGTTAAGASSACETVGFAGCGTVFKIASDGTLTTLHSFDGSDGFQPLAALIQATDGSFYGTTFLSPASTACLVRCGTIFKITSGGALTTLHSFDLADGAGPDGALIEAADGNFYGTTFEGGASSSCFRGCGTVFQVTPAGVLTTLHSLEGTDGANPFGGLVQGTNGRLYGTTSGGGASDSCSFGCGTVFSLDVGLGPFVETVPTSGNVGQRVLILGTNLTGATRVTFNGAPTLFGVLSPSLIKAVVPAAATTGTVRVTTPSGTLSSNVPFTIR